MLHSNRCPLLIAAVCSLLCASAPPARAEVVGVDIASRADVENGAAFGDAGAYEAVSGKIRFAVDPANARNQVIVGLEHAPRNDAGKVEFSADFAILRPKDPAKGNGTLLLDVVNRGNKTVINSFDRAVANGHDDGFLMRRGFTVVWVGWEFDVSKGMRIDVPQTDTRCVVHGSLTPNTDLEAAAMFSDLSGYMPNEAAPKATLSVRDGLLGKPTPIASGRFKLEGNNVVTLKDGFTAGRTYELSYDIARAPVGGLGFAAVRDTVSWLKSAPDMNVRVQRTLAFGLSQSGRFLRTFLYHGFNADEHGRQVFDGVMAHIAGASRLDLNRACATPTNLGQFDATSFPFADQALRDPASGPEEGALDNPRARDFKPKVFYTNTGVEYWGGARAAALIHTTPDGGQDLALPDNERVYFLTGSQHGPARFPPAEPRFGAQRENPNDYWLAMRALLVAMDEWLRGGAAPPPSRYPRLADKTLVRAAEVAFPSLPGRSRAADAAGRSARGESHGAARRRTRYAAAVSRSPNRPRWPRARRSPPARDRGTPRDVHRLELPQRGDRRRGPALPAARLVHPVSRDSRRASGGQRSARVDRRALRVEAGVPRQSARGRRQARRGALLARRGPARGARAGR